MPISREESYLIEKNLLKVKVIAVKPTDEIKNKGGNDEIRKLSSSH